jgi:hypothetical protein
MSRFSIWLLLSSLSLLFAASLGCSKSPVDRAQEFLDAGMASQALPLLEIEIQSNPKNAQAHLMVGEASLMLNDPEAARASFDRAVLLNPRCSAKVARAYFDVAQRLASGDRSEPALAVAYLEAARARTHALDKPIARCLRRIGLDAGSANLLRSAAEVDAGLANDDSVAMYIATDPNQESHTRLQLMEQFLAAHAKSALRPRVLLECARSEVVDGTRAKAKAYAQEAARSAVEQETKAAAELFLQDIASTEQSEREAGEAAQRAEQQATENIARLRLQGQALEARRVAAEREAAAREQELAIQRKTREQELAVRRATAAKRAEALEAGQQIEVRLFNVDDTATASVNGAKVLSAGYQEDTGWRDITAHCVPGDNQIDLALWNSGGGYTYGFGVRVDGRSVYSVTAGQAGSSGADNNSQQTGEMFHKRLVFVLQ